LAARATRALMAILRSCQPGHCLCGAITFTAEHVETDHHACHCGMCRRWAGGNGFLAAVAREVAFTGETPARYASSEWAERGFCARCGTTLFYFLKPTAAYMMSVGAFDDQTPFTLVRELFIDAKPAGYAYAGDHERWTAAETFARRAP
jgi:hypothetical protein